MKEIPIIFSTPMVQAILDGRKTMTRRLKGLSFINKNPNFYEYLGIGDYPNDSHPAVFKQREPGGDIIIAKFPYEAGQILWVRERFWSGTDMHYDPLTLYFADSRDARPFDVSDDWCINEYGHDKNDWPKWKPSIHMPKSACRIWLEVVSVKVERLQDITEQDARSEGVERSYTVTRDPGTEYKNYFPENRGGSGFVRATWSFESLWQSIHGTDSWELNPFVWAIEFRRIDKSPPPSAKTK